jgi:two-component system, NtrC family, sensor kinase
MSPHLAVAAPLLDELDHALGEPPPRRREPSLRPAPEAHTHRLASLGLVTASVAHDMASPLGAVIGNLGFATALLAEASASGRPLEPRRTGEALAALREALDAAEQLRAISGELRTMARSDDGPPEVVLIERAVERALSMARGELLRRAVVERRLAPLPPVRGREGKLVQVLVNLLVNAAHAIPEGRPAEHRVVVSASPRPGGLVALEVMDTGCGIPAAQLPRLFEPFFTTKPVGQGTGLGLAICRTIVLGLGGEIEVESEVGRGTTVRLLLPVG